MALYDAVADLQLKIERHDLLGYTQDTPSGWTRHSTEVHLKGDGFTGRGEDITYQEPDQLAFQKAGPQLELAGDWTVDSFSHALDCLPLFSSPPRDEKSWLFRRWAFESAALDLALQQAGLSLATALGRAPAPVTFVVSQGLGSPPSLAALDRLWNVNPDMGLKLDANLDWSEELIAELARSGKVTTVDLKGQYHGDFSGTAPDADLYRRVAVGLPDVWLEDPGWTDATRSALADHQARVTYDAPVCSLADVVRISPEPRSVNIKPSRFGFVSELFRTYEYCEARGISMYGGGQFELQTGRGQIQYLASLFHAEAPNDVAPSAFNEAVLPADLPTSPLEPRLAATGFRWA